MVAFAIQAGERVAAIESAVTSLQKSTEEFRTDFKARDKQAIDAVAEARKASEDLRVSVKAQSSDLASIQESMYRLHEITKQPRPPQKPQ